MRPIDNSVLEAEIELTAQDLLAPFDNVIELDDVLAIDVVCEDGSAANAGEARQEDPLQETSEIELTPDQMDAMLEGRWPI